MDFNQKLEAPQYKTVISQQKQMNQIKIQSKPDQLPIYDR